MIWQCRFRLEMVPAGAVNMRDRCPDNGASGLYVPWYLDIREHYHHQTQVFVKTRNVFVMTTTGYLKV